MTKLALNIVDNLATKYRLDCGLSLSEAIDTKKILMKYNILTLFRPLSENFAGLCIKSSDSVRFILVNSNSTIGRQHFTIAHEFYHLFIEEKPISHICHTSISKDYNEQNADMFASVLLMPQKGILQMISSEDIINKNVPFDKVIRMLSYIFQRENY